MSTRKLILLALACGLAILLAGGIKLFQVARDPAEVEVLALGENAEVGDMEVTVLDVIVRPDATLVDVEMVGVDGDDAAEGWRLLADGSVREPVDANPGDACPPTSVTEPVRCTVAFAAVESTPIVAYVRAGEQRQWAAGAGES